MRLRTRPEPPDEELVAIETRLSGVLYRSRLEARWAIWFRELGIEVEYEAHGYRVAGRMRWPDFWSETLGCYIEVKPEGVEPDEALALGVAEASGEPLLWLSGNPRAHGHKVTWFPRADLPPVPNLRWALGRRTQELWLLGVAPPIAIRLSPSLDGPLTWETARGLEWPRPDAGALKEAYRQASTYQFEDSER